MKHPFQSKPSKPANNNSGADGEGKPSQETPNSDAAVKGAQGNGSEGDAGSAEQQASQEEAKREAEERAQGKPAQRPEKTGPDEADVAKLIGGGIRRLQKNAKGERVAVERELRPEDVLAFRWDQANRTLTAVLADGRKVSQVVR